MKRAWLSSILLCLWLFAAAACSAPQSAPESKDAATPTDSQVDQPANGGAAPPSRGAGANGEEPEEQSPASEANCFAGSDFADFPWPPPEPSAQITIPRAILLAGVADDEPALIDIGDRLERALSSAGYVEYGYHGVGCDGFALVTRLERIDGEGRPVDGAERWAPPERGEPFSLASYIARLFYAPPGYYRQIVFLATDRRIRETADAPTREELETLVREGAAALPETYDEAPFTRSHRLTALIYEFEKGEADEDVAQLTPSRFGGAVHLDQAGIYSGLDGDN